MAKFKFPQMLSGAYASVDKIPQRIKQALYAAGVVKIKAIAENNALICLVDLNKLKFGPYQRDADKNHVKKIAKSFDPTVMAPFRVGFRNGGLWCWDGRQGSYTLMQTQGRNQWDALVFLDSTEKKECEQFYYANEIQKKQSGWKKFMSGYKAGLASHAAIMKMLVSVNLYDQKSKNAPQVSAKALLEAYAKDETNRVLKCFGRVMGQCWRDQNGAIPKVARKIDFQRGLIDFISLNIDKEYAIVAFLKTWTPEEIQNAANKEEAEGRIDAAQFRKAFQGIYDASVKGRRAAA